MNQVSNTRQRWTAADIPDQRGRTAVVTGANSGIGFEAAKALAARGASVILACRNLDRGQEAADRISADAPAATVGILQLDLASLASVRQAADDLRARHERVDLLINNAGLMWPPYGQTTDGFELQFGTNHLGHFAFTGLVLDRLLPVPGARIVTVSSTGHRLGKIDFDDLQSVGKYRRVPAYGQSKLANLMFTYELQRRLTAAGATPIAVAAHPGLSSTELTRHAPAWLRGLDRRLGSLIAQTAPMGALPTLRAAADPSVRGGDYFGPGGRFEVKGHPKRVRSSARSHDAEVQRRLWEESEKLTGVAYDFGPTG